MANDWFCDGVNGDAAGTGTSWSNATLTITQLLALGFAAGDSLFVGPGTYRETATLPAGGATVTALGTVSVTNESTTVTGAGAANFVVAAVAAGDQFFIGNFGTAADGIGSAGAGYTSAASAQFQSSMVGYMIEIIGEGAYLIAGWTNANTITLSDRDGTAWPAAAGGQTFYIVSGEGPYEVASVTDATHIELTEPWSGPTLTAQVYEVYRPVYLIADVTGANTDGVGGIVRVSGTADDTTDPGLYTRANGFVGSAGDDYWHIRGFTVTTHSATGYLFDQCDMICVEDTVGVDNVGGLMLGTDPTRHVLRRAISLAGLAGPILSLTHTGHIDNSQSVGYDLYAYSGAGVYVDDVGGTTVKNMTMGFFSDYALSVTGVQVGNSVFLHDSQIHYSFGDAVRSTAAQMVVETLNNYWQNSADLDANVTGGPPITAPDTAYPYLPMLPLLSGRQRNPMTFFAPSEWDATRYAAGLYGANLDLFGTHNEVSQTRRSLGAMHAYAVKRSRTQIYDALDGSMYMENAAEKQFKYPVQPGATYTISVQVYTEPNYTGNVADMVVMQPGATAVTATSSGAKGVWEQLSTTFTTGAEIDWIDVVLRSHNTSAVPSYGIYWNLLQARR